MNNRNDKKPINHGTSAYAAFAAHKISKQEKRAWIAVAIAILIQLLCWWARSSL